MSEPQKDLPVVIFDVVCSDGVAQYTHYIGPYGWRFVQRLLDLGGEEAASRTIDLSQYMTVEGIQMLQSIFDHRQTFIRHVVFKKREYGQTLCITACHTSITSLPFFGSKREKSGTVILDSHVFAGMLKWAIELDIRYCSENVLCSDSTSSEQQVECTIAYRDEGGVASPHACNTSACQNILINILVRMAAHRLWREKRFPSECWLQIGTTETMCAIREFVPRSFPWVVSRGIVQYAESYFDQFDEFDCSTLDDSIISCLFADKSFLRDWDQILYKHAFAKKLSDLFQKYLKSKKSAREIDILIYEQDILCDGSHHKDMACPLGFNCRHRSIEDRVWREYMS